MKIQFVRFLAVTSLLVAPLHAEFRSWTNTEGVKIDAEWVKTEQDSVTLRTRSGKTSAVPLSKLSTADQDFAKKQTAAASADVKPATTVASDRKAKWLTRMDKAQAESKETGLPILVLFTGTKWCPYCIKLEKAVFSESEFKTFADQKLVLLLLDFGPGGETSNRKDQELSKQYGVKGFPTYFLVDPAGKTLAQGGYHDGITPASFDKWVETSAPKK